VREKNFFPPPDLGATFIGEKDSLNRLYLVLLFTHRQKRKAKGKGAKKKKKKPHQKKKERTKKRKKERNSKVLASFVSLCSAMLLLA